MEIPYNYKNWVQVVKELYNKFPEAETVKYQNGSSVTEIKTNAIKEEALNEIFDKCDFKTRDVIRLRDVVNKSMMPDDFFGNIFNLLFLLAND